MPSSPSLCFARLAVLAAAALLAGAASAATMPPASGAEARAELPVKVKVFVAAMFEIGQNTGDRAGEFQHWYERYWKGAKPMAVPGALQPVYCNADGVCVAPTIVKLAPGAQWTGVAADVVAR